MFYPGWMRGVVGTFHDLRIGGLRGGVSEMYDG